LGPRECLPRESRKACNALQNRPWCRTADSTPCSLWPIQLVLPALHVPDFPRSTAVWKIRCDRTTSAPTLSGSFRFSAATPRSSYKPFRPAAKADLASLLSAGSTAAIPRRSLRPPIQVDQIPATLDASPTHDQFREHGGAGLGALVDRANSGQSRAICPPLSLALPPPPRWLSTKTKARARIRGYFEELEKNGTGWATSQEVELKGRTNREPPEVLKGPKKGRKKRVEITRLTLAGRPENSLLQTSYFVTLVNRKSPGARYTGVRSNRF